MPPKRKAAEAAASKLANTKKPTKEKKKKEEAISCTLYNDTSKEICRAWEVSLEYKASPTSDGHSMTNISAIAPGGHGLIQLPAGAVDGLLKISKVGLVFQDGSTTAPVVNGAEYRVRLDETDPPLSKEEALKAADHILAVLEGASPIPFSVLYTPDRFGHGRASKGIVKLSPEEREAADNSLWKWIVKGLGREEAANKPESLKKIKKMIMDGSCFSSERRRFFDVYSSHPRKPVVDESVSIDDIKNGLTQDKAKIIVYYRAMDRFPGGNCDSFVVKYTLDLASGETTAFRWADWDGSQNFSVAPVSLPELANKFKKNTVPALVALLDEQKASAEGKPLLFESTIEDQSSDSDEYDTEWTSIEVLVYLPEKQSSFSENKPVLHVHQYAVYPNWCSYGRDEKPALDTIEAHPQAQEVLDSLEKVFKMERPEAFSDGGETIHTLGDTEEIISIGYFAPIFLKVIS